MNREQKQQVVAELNGVFSDASTVVAAHYKGLNVAAMEELRSSARAVGTVFRVAKNRLVRRALQGTSFEGISGLFTGQTVLSVSKDPVAAAKVVYDFVKDNDKLVVLGGALYGVALDPRGVESLAAMPSLDQLRAKLARIINVPASRVVGVLGQPGAQLSRLLSLRQDALPSH